MVAKIVTILLTDGRKEDVVCFDFCITTFNDEVCMVFDKGSSTVYAVPISKLSTAPFDIKYMWVFQSGSDGSFKGYGF